MKKFSISVPSKNKLEEMGRSLSDSKYDRFIEFLRYDVQYETDYYYCIIRYFFELFDENDVDDVEVN